MVGTGHTIALHLALENVAHEVDILARKALAIDDAMGAAISSEDAVELLPLELTQDVDLMRQSTDCVHILLRNLATITQEAGTPPDFVDAEAVTKGVYLSAIRDRVTSKPAAPKDREEELGDWIDL